MGDTTRFSALRNSQALFLVCIIMHNYFRFGIFESLLSFSSSKPMLRRPFLRYFLLFVLTFLGSQVGMAQDRYAVFFKYKPQQEFSLANPSQFLTSKALQRRDREKLALDSLDLPVAASYLQGIRPAIVELLYSSKWLNAAVVVADTTGKKWMEALPYVEKVNWIAKGFIPKEGNRQFSQILNPWEVDSFSKWEIEENYRQAEAYDFQNHLLGIEKMHQAGFTGKNRTIAIFDSGFPGMDTISAFAPVFKNKQLVGQLNVVRPWIKGVFRDHEHGTQVASLILAYQPGSLVSGAYGAKIILATTEDVTSEYPIEEFNWVRAAEYADSLGVDIINSSLGYLDFDEPSLTYSNSQLDGKTTFISRGATIAGKKGILVVTSVGNYGSAGGSSLVAPADAAGILSVGAVTSTASVAAFSSRGPTADGRTKPELAAFGQNAVVIRPSGQVVAVSGTSFSAPQITALAAGLWEARPDWTKEELLNNLFQSGSQYTSPDQNLGYGIPNFREALYGALLGVTEEEVNGTLIYPNPIISTNLFIQVGNDTRLFFQLRDGLGRLIFEKMAERQSSNVPYQIDLPVLVTGIYLIQASDSNEIVTKKLIKR